MKTLKNLLAAGALALSAYGSPAIAETLESKVTTSVTPQRAPLANEEAEQNVLRATVCLRNTQMRRGGLLGAWLDKNYDGKSDISDAHVKAWEAYKQEHHLDDRLQAPWNAGSRGRVEKFTRGIEPEIETSWFGTGFAYKVENGYVYFATNWHVAGEDDGDMDWLFGKVASTRVEVVDNWDDDFRPDDLKIEYVSGLPASDMAVLRAKVEDVERYNAQIEAYNQRNPKKRAAKQPVEAFKGKVGNSSDLKLGDALVMYGYPHAASRTRHTGAVTDEYYHQLWPGMWDHEAFMTDTTTAPGNSGSAVMHVTENGELEWVGQLNAGFRGGDNINFVIGVDNYKKLIENPHATKPQEDVEMRVAKLVKTAKDTPDQHKLFDDISQLTIDADGTVHVVIYGDYPYAKNNRIEFIDKPGNKYGTLDAVIVADENGTMLFSSNGLPYYFKENSQKLYNALTQMLMYSYARHTYEGVTPRTAFEHEQLTRIGAESKILEIKNGMLYQFVTQGLRQHARSMRDWGTPYEGPKKDKPKDSDDKAE